MNTAHETISAHILNNWKTFILIVLKLFLAFKQIWIVGHENQRWKFRSWLGRKNRENIFLKKIKKKKDEKLRVLSYKIKKLREWGTYVVFYLVSLDGVILPIQTGEK